MSRGRRARRIRAARGRVPRHRNMARATTFLSGGVIDNADLRCYLSKLGVSMSTGDNNAYQWLADRLFELEATAQSKNDELCHIPAEFRAQAAGLAGHIGSYLSCLAEEREWNGDTFSGLANGVREVLLRNRPHPLRVWCPGCGGWAAELKRTPDGEGHACAACPSIDPLAEDDMDDQHEEFGSDAILTQPGENLIDSVRSSRGSGARRGSDNPPLPDVLDREDRGEDTNAELYNADATEGLKP